MSKSRNLADLLDANGDVATGALDNVPPSNDASALTTGTLSADRLGAGSISAAKLADTYLTPTGDGSNLTGLSSSNSKITVDLESGTSLTAGRAVSLSPNGKAANYPTLNTIGDEVDVTNVSVSAECPDGETRAYGLREVVSEQTRITVYGQVVNQTTLAVTQSSTTFSVTASGGSGSEWQSPVGIWAIGDNYYVGYAGNTRSDNSYRASDVHMFAFKVNPTTGVPTKIAETNYYRDWGNGYVFAYPQFAKITDSIFWVGSTSQNNGVYYHYRRYHHFDKATESFTTQNAYGVATSGPTVYAYNGDSFRKTLITSDNATLLSINGNTLYKQATANSGKGLTNNSYTTSSLRNDYSGNAQKYFPDDTHLIYYYKNVSNSYIFVLYSVASNGDLTELDTLDVGTTNIWDSGFMSTGSSYKELIFSGVGGYRTLLIDDNDNFVGLGVPITYYGENGGGFKIDDTTFAVKGTGTNGAFYRKFTVNAYQTDPFEYLGLSNDTASSGSAEITVAGVKDGYTGLTVGATYYLSDAYDGTINTDSTKGTPKIGKAISSTEILMAEIS